MRPPAPTTLDKPVCARMCPQDLPSVVRAPTPTPAPKKAKQAKKKKAAKAVDTEL